MDVGGITVVFAADIASLVAGVQSVVENISALSSSATTADDLAASVESATTAVEGLATASSSVSEVSSSLADVTTAASGVSDALTNVATTASEVGASISDVSASTSAISEVDTEVSGLADMFAQAQAAVSEFATGVMEQLSEAGAAVMEYSTNSKNALSGIGGAFQAGQQGISGFMSNMSQLGMGFFAVQGGIQMVQGAFQQATGPFGNFQEQLTQLVTGAGESQSALGTISDGIKQMAIQTGTSTDQLTAGMYMIDSAGYTAAKGGLSVLQAAAEGAKVGAADLATVANAVTSALNAYGLQGKDAASVTNQLIATVAAGKMHMQDLANSLSAVLPVAAAAHISYAQIGGAIATMTAQGTSAQQATQNLANTIRSLQSPNAQAVQEMQAMGLNANQVSMQLGQKGLTGTLGEITQAILAHMGPAGTVLQSAFKASATAAADAKTEIAAMPKSLQGIAQQFLAGSLSTKQWSKDISGLDPITKHMMQQFATTAKQTDSFNSLLTKGGPSAQTYTTALSKILGGATGLNTALQLTGTHMGTFQANVASVAGAAKNGGNSITGWKLVQDDFNQKMAVASAQAQVFWIGLGEKLAPAVLQVMAGLQNLVAIGASVASFFQHNQVAMDLLIAVLAGVAGGILAFAATAIPALVAGFIAWAIAAGSAAIATMAAAWPFILIGAVIAAVVLGIILAVQHWGQITSWLKGVWSAFSGWFMGAMHAVGAFFVGAWNGMVHGIQVAIAFIVNIVKIGFQLWLAYITFPIRAVVAIFSWLYNHNYYFQRLVDFIVNIFKAGLAWVQGAWQNTVNVIVGIWDWLVNAAMVAFKILILIIGGPILWITLLIMAHWNQIKGYLAAAWAWIVSTAQTLWQHVVSIFQQAWGGISAAVHAIWTNLAGIFSNLASQAISWGANIIKGFISGIQSMLGAVGNAAHNVISTVAGFLGFHSPAKEGPGAELDIWGPNLVRGFAEGLEHGIPLVQAAVTHLIRPTTALGQYTGGSNTPTSPLQGANGGGQQTVVHTHIYLDSEELAGVMTHHVATSIVSQARAAGPVGRAA